MPRFFFHLRGDGQNFEDAIGSVFETAQHAEMAALRAASYMLEQAKDAAQLYAANNRRTSASGTP